MDTEDEVIDVRIVRAQCRCSSCPENGIIYIDDGPDRDGNSMWCKSIEVQMDYHLWLGVVLMVKANRLFNVVFDDSGIN